jgi:endogenous inhibitor of DNA gyrase (YacG/DUF329 family)
MRARSAVTPLCQARCHAIRYAAIAAGDATFSAPDADASDAERDAAAAARAMMMR